MVISLCDVLFRWVLQLATLRLPSNEFKDLDIVVLRHELAIRRRRFGRRMMTWSDRLFLAAASRLLPRGPWQSVIITPATLASSFGGEALDVRASSWPATDPPRHASVGPSSGAREQDVGVSTHGRRIEGPWHRGLGGDGSHMASERGSGTGWHPWWQDLARMRASHRPNMLAVDVFTVETI